MTHMLLGLDIGGTSTQGLVAEYTAGQWNVVARANGPSANVQNVSAQAAVAALDQVASHLGLSPLPAGTALHVVAGSGGVDTPEDAEQLRARIAQALGVVPGQKGLDITVVHDTRLILAAGGQDTGIAVIAGTGSVAWGRTADGQESRSGGWGHLLGDEGSSWWVAREAVRRSLRRHDMGLPADDLDCAVLQARGLDARDHLIADFHSHAERTEWAGLARLVDQNATVGHQDSQELLLQAATHLVTAAKTVVTQLGVTGPVVVGGGLISHSAQVRSAFRDLADDAGLTDVVVLEQDPVMGTLHLAGQPPRN
ncbi:BadF/BadG/BcrA/BcrD ATPase family protein [Kocuria sp. ZOR0020]|uniref:BadF/BadG/BcrA/BcrD ATPase family protein n=1 Tax=Kocuria sp. ZOR0020 TaxID=1339234 RepID=UPI001E62868B|nr:BadF/BadG/BcrA/BcrD ATPase family protein [Kocuria sp. ZOR0020]